MSNAMLEVEDVKDSIQGTESKITVAVNGVETEEYSKEKKSILGLTDGINKTWKESVNNYMTIAKVCASAYKKIKDDSIMEDAFMKRLTFGDKVFKKFVKIGNANLEKLYGTEVVSSINDYNVLSELSKNDMIADTDEAKSKRESLISAVKVAITEKKTVNRDLVEEFTKEENNDKDKVDTKTYDKVVASIRVNSSTFTSTSDLESLNELVDNILSGFDKSFEVIVEKKKYEDSISNKISALKKLLNNNKNLQLVKK